jgi:anti-sigma factor RsiW
MERHVSQEQISALIDKQLSSHEASAVQFHLTQCCACRALYEELSEVTELFQNADALEPSPFLWQRVAAEITPPLAPASRGWLAGFGFHEPVWVAAGLATVLLGVLIFTAEFRSLQLARQKALDEIENVRLAMNSSNPEINNPFRAILMANQNRNPFTMKRLSAESNPFRPVAAR